MNSEAEKKAPPKSLWTVDDFREDLEKRHKYHEDIVLKHVKRSKPWGFIFALAIPILSAFVTFLSAGVFKIDKEIYPSWGLDLLCSQFLIPY